MIRLRNLRGKVKPKVGEGKRSLNRQQPAHPQLHHVLHHFSHQHLKTVQIIIYEVPLLMYCILDFQHLRLFTFDYFKLLDIYYETNCKSLNMNCLKVKSLLRKILKYVRQQLVETSCSYLLTLSKKLQLYCSFHGLRERLLV